MFKEFAHICAPYARIPHRRGSEPHHTKLAGWHRWKAHCWIVLSKRFSFRQIVWCPKTTLIWGKLRQRFLTGQEFEAQLEFPVSSMADFKTARCHTLGWNGQRWECPSWPNFADLACEGRASWALFTTTLEGFGNMMGSSVIFQVRDSRCSSIYCKFWDNKLQKVIDLTKKGAIEET